MMKTKLFLIIILIIPALLQAQPTNYWQQHTNYTINVTFEPQKKLLTGIETIFYTNNSPDTLNYLYFHLYPNAFSDTSLMYKEAAKKGLKLISNREHQGSIKISNLSIQQINKSDKTSLDNTFKVEETLMKVDLSQPILPHRQLEIKMDFQVKIRKYNAAGGKGGYCGDHFVISQWYPKICVYDENKWNDIPYHWLREFYGEFGTYDVTINVPFDYIVGATGSVIAGDPGWEEVKIEPSLDNKHWEEKEGNIREFLRKKASKNTSRAVRFSAENVHDFVWIVSKDFIYENGSYNDIPVHVLYNAKHKTSWSKRALNTAIESLDSLNSYVGEYPYPQLTVAQGFYSSAMEYPMVVFLGITRTSTVFHEIAHNYFYGALANNEYREGWLDEGLVTFLTERFIEDRKKSQQKKQIPKPKYKFPLLERQYRPVSLKHSRLNYLYYYLYSDLETPISTPSYNCNDKVEYSLNYYVKGSEFFRMLRYIVGKDCFQAILQKYYNSWRFKHVNEDRFKKICEQVSGMELDWFFKQWLHNTVKIDYAITSLKKNKQENGKWATKVNLKRCANGIMPVEVLLTTIDNKEYRQQWDGKDKTSSVTFLTSTKPKEAALDPNDIILDQFRINNYSPKFKFIWYPNYPNLYYQPRNEYLISCWPRVWYNNIDQTKIGVKLFGGYLNRYHVTRSSLWYGFKSRQIDFRWTFTNPCEFLSNNTRYNLVLAKLEGRYEGNFNLLFIKRKYLFSLPVYNIRVGMHVYRLYDKDYVQQKINGYDIPYWEDNDISKLYINFYTKFKKNRFIHEFDIRAGTSNKIWGSEKEFTKIYGNYKSNCTFKNFPFTFYFRLFTAMAFYNGSNLPVQEKFYLAEASPTAQFRKFYSRTKDPFFDKVNYHFPGGGNLRGYINKYIDGVSPLTGDRLFTSNLEIAYKNVNSLLPYVGDFINNKICKISCGLFFDAGIFNVDSAWKKPLTDTGFGVTFSRKYYTETYKLRFDFPIWLNRPNIDNLDDDIDKFKFRWLVSFESAL